MLKDATRSLPLCSTCVAPAQHNAAPQKKYANMDDIDMVLNTALFHALLPLKVLKQVEKIGMVGNDWDGREGCDVT